MIEPFNFAEALNHLRRPRPEWMEPARVARLGWNERSMYLVLVHTWAAPPSLAQIGPTLPFIAMRTVGGELVPWLASQTDMLADDWVTL